MGTSLKKVAKKCQGLQVCVAGDASRQKAEPFGDGGDAGRELTDKGP